MSGKAKMRVAASVGAGLYALLLFWLSGFDFNERGAVGVAAGLLFPAVVLIVASYPGWDSE